MQNAQVTPSNNSNKKIQIRCIMEERRKDMRFEMNGTEYWIVEVEEEKMRDGEEAEEGEYYYGQTDYERHLVMIDKKLGENKKRKTLYHELMHVYIKEYITTEDLGNISEEMLCDFSANAHDIIHEITKKYFEGRIF